MTMPLDPTAREALYQAVFLAPPPPPPEHSVATECLVCYHPNVTGTGLGPDNHHRGCPTGQHGTPNYD